MTDLDKLGFTLGIDDFCGFCPDFEPELEQIDCSTYGDQHDGTKRVLNIVRCEIKATGFFERVRSNDHNINHFANRGMLDMRYYDSGLY